MMKIENILLIFCTMIFLISPIMAIPNPSIVYCEKMGYTYKINITAEGEEGICVVNPGVEFKAWDFIKGKVGKEYSYCAKQGFETETEQIDKNSYSEEYAICISKNTSIKEINTLLNVNSGLLMQALGPKTFENLITEAFKSYASA